MLSIILHVRLNRQADDSSLAARTELERHSAGNLGFRNGFAEPQWFRDTVVAGFARIQPVSGNPPEFLRIQLQMCSCTQIWTDVMSLVRAGENQRKPGASWKARSKPRSSLGVLRKIVPRKQRNSLPGKMLRTHGNIAPRIARCGWTTSCYQKSNVTIL